ncbi:GCFC [Lepeophtheirus salmonis]|uniref:GCFC n=1 Tax=Lepeophtheirus salmonis TaxID=72036 RepID=A0A7R8D1M0_LEPSM|nr:GCFC [Lepeophtheirus salmonis]CAF2996572.1 GCFC [Lepeophtheirus salmonis]
MFKSESLSEETSVTSFGWQTTLDRRRRGKDPRKEPPKNNTSNIKSFKKPKRNVRTSKIVGLSFDGEEDEGEVFQVKKSSTSRRLIKQKKRKDKLEVGEPLKVHSPPKLNSLDSEFNIKLYDNTPKKKEIQEYQEEKLEEKDKSWTLTGREAEALHYEEEDLDEHQSDNNNDDDTIKKILQKGAIPDAAAIHAARKAREAARLRGETSNNVNEKSGEFIPLNDGRKGCSGKSRLVRDDDNDDDGENERVAFNGLHSQSKQRDIDRKKLQYEYEEEDGQDDIDHWEEQQIRKVVKNNSVSIIAPMCREMDLDVPEIVKESSLLDIAMGKKIVQKPLQSYNLDGIRSRIRDRLKSIQEVQRRHTLDMDKAVDNLIEKLRGYVSDLVECFNEKLINIKYLEEKMNKSKLDILTKIMERRRQDVRDQMIELSSKKSSVITADHTENTEEAQRVRRAAEREGRRRRRREQRNKQISMSSLSLSKNHDEGLSSDDELSSIDAANISKVGKEVENQARTILSDVIDELQLLFWNPLTEHTNIETMEWYKALAVYSYRYGENIDALKKDPDKRLIPSLVEKVLIPKTTGLIHASYDPTSSSQTSRLVRKLLTTVKEKIKSSVDNDIYIPMGYSKSLLENNSSGHSLFFQRQFWSCLKLFKNILNWHEILSDSVITDLAISSILNRYLLIALGINPDPIDSLDKCRIIVTAFSSELLKSMKGNQSELKRFAHFLRIFLPCEKEVLVVIHY